MEFFTWEERLNTGIDIIDSQHQRIASHINALYAAIPSQDKGLVGETISQLLDYTQSHLQFEEQLIEAAGYPGTEDHKAKHTHFNKRIHHYFKRHTLGGDIALPLISELKMWLTTHILYDDNDYVPCIKQYMEGFDFPSRIAI
jgi:hemerythrin